MKKTIILLVIILRIIPAFAQSDSMTTCTGEKVRMGERTSLERGQYADGDNFWISIDSVWYKKTNAGDYVELCPKNLSQQSTYYAQDTLRIRKYYYVYIPSPKVPNRDSSIKVPVYYIPLQHLSSLRYPFSVGPATHPYYPYHYPYPRQTEPRLPYYSAGDNKESYSIDSLYFRTRYGGSILVRDYLEKSKRCIDKLSKPDTVYSWALTLQGKPIQVMEIRQPEIYSSYSVDLNLEIINRGLSENRLSALWISYFSERLLKTPEPVTRDPYKEKIDRCACMYGFY